MVGMEQQLEKLSLWQQELVVRLIHILWINRQSKPQTLYFITQVPRLTRISWGPGGLLQESTCRSSASDWWVERLSVSFCAHHLSLAIWVSQFTEDVDIHMEIFQNHPSVLEADPRLICLSPDPKSRAESFD